MKNNKGRWILGETMLHYFENFYISSNKIYSTSIEISLAEIDR